jgi:hypothetical protein
MRNSIAITFCVALLTVSTLGGCASSMYSGVPDDSRYAVPTGEDRSYVGGEPESTEEATAEARPEDNPDAQYVYRGGRDPVSGRAHKQM